MEYKSSHGCHGKIWEMPLSLDGRAIAVDDGDDDIL